MGILGLSRTRFAVLACLLIAGYFVYTASLGTLRNREIARDHAEAAEQVAHLEGQKAYLEGVRDYVATDIYVEQEARRQLGYVRPGEIPFVVVGPALDDDETPGVEWYERLFPR